MTEAIDAYKESTGFVKQEMADAFDSHKITADSLTALLNEGLTAKETKIIKVKGAIDKADLPDGFEVVATSGYLSHDKEGEIFGDGETLVKYEVIDHRTRQDSRKDAHKMRNDYPAEKREHTGEIRTTMQLSDEDRKLIGEVKEKLKDAIIAEHLESINSRD